MTEFFVLLGLIWAVGTLVGAALFVDYCRRVTHSPRLQRTEGRYDIIRRYAQADWTAYFASIILSFPRWLNHIRFWWRVVRKQCRFSAKLELLRLEREVVMTRRRTRDKHAEAEQLLKEAAEINRKADEINKEVERLEAYNKKLASEFGLKISKHS